MGSIKNVVSEPIEGHEDYHMMVTVLVATCISERSIMVMYQSKMKTVAMIIVTTKEQTRLFYSVMLN